MHLLAESKVDISCSVSRAFAFATNMERFAEWFPAVLSIESIDQLNHGQVGKQYLETVSVPVRRIRKITLTVVESRQDQLFVTEGAFPPLLPRMEILFNSTGPDACQVTWRMLSRNRSPIAKFTILPLAKSVMTKRARAGLSKLKEKLEGRGSRS
ncbi:SRPBCC family protein [Leptonema illini]|uniref:Polyketide cyclase/dehydrase n=2 Tax=Leptonema illini TaxID=183 RepID=H2CLC2_9LEPT|nr:SRPBCC family protein [Leptonema illini]EHQ04533.1 Polyketide cyclase/dehydrase [Leptonema illini DSM 21528]